MFRCSGYIACLESTICRVRTIGTRSFIVLVGGRGQVSESMNEHASMSNLLLLANAHTCNHASESGILCSKLD